MGGLMSSSAAQLLGFVMALSVAEAFVPSSLASLGLKPQASTVLLQSQGARVGRYSKFCASSLKMAASTEVEVQMAGVLPRERYLVFNRFQTRNNKGAKFEKRWAERKSSLKSLQGFRYFCLLRLCESYKSKDGSKMEYPEGTPDYMSMTVWETKKDFNSWRTGYAFKEAHGGGTIGGFLSALVANLGILKGPPAVYLWDGLLPVSVPEAESPLALKGRNTEGKVEADGETSVPTDAFVAMNRFIVKQGKEEEFEKGWQERESKLKEFDGFVGFTLMRRDKPAMSSERPDDVFNYSTLTVWRSQQDFINWRDRPSESNGTSKMNLMELVESPPSPIFWEGTLAVQQETGM